MAWIESHQTLRDHPKLKRLARALGAARVTAIGHLHCLWWWALTYAPAGDLSAFSDEDLAEAAAWEGDPAAFRGALSSAGFLEADGTLHDWLDYAGRYLDERDRGAERRAADAQRKRAMRDASRIRAYVPRVKSADSPADDTGLNGPVLVSSGRTKPDVRFSPAVTGPNRTGPDRTGPDPALSGGGPARESSAAPGSPLDQFFAVLEAEADYRPSPPVRARIAREFTPQATPQAATKLVAWYADKVKVVTHNGVVDWLREDRDNPPRPAGPPRNGRPAGPPPLDPKYAALERANA